MKKRLIILCIIIILITVSFCGCNENKPSAIKVKKGGITLKSDIVELAESKFEFIKTSEYDPECDCEIEHLHRVDVSYLFHNIAGRNIAAEVTLELYDEDGNLLWVSPYTKTINLLDDYTERGYFGANTISYDGQWLDQVYEAILIVEEGK